MLWSVQVVHKTPWQGEICDHISPDILENYIPKKVIKCKIRIPKTITNQKMLFDSLPAHVLQALHISKSRNRMEQLNSDRAKLGT